MAGLPSQWKRLAVLRRRRFDLARPNKHKNRCSNKAISIKNIVFVLARKGGVARYGFAPPPTPHSMETAQQLPVPPHTVNNC
ncbi:hypothetical protein J6590_057272 [Homalodisca vitripennis]|nr:hypothetical protein J6590_057272 [Homalodisca vitripennis]